MRSSDSSEQRAEIRGLKAYLATVHAGVQTETVNKQLRLFSIFVFIGKQPQNERVCLCGIVLFSLGMRRVLGTVVLSFAY